MIVQDSIEAIEQSLHQVICERVEELLENNGQSLPKAGITLKIIKFNPPPPISCLSPY